MLSKSEIQTRINKFYQHMNQKHPDWDIAIIASEVNQYYYTGTMQNGLLIFLPNGDVHFFVKKSYARAKIECMIDSIHQMNSYRDIVLVIGSNFSNGYLELSKIPIKMYQMFNKHLKIENPLDLDSDVNYLRSIKSEYELGIMRQAGIVHDKLLNEIVPTVIYEGMSEFELVTELNYQMFKLGHFGTARFDMFNQQYSCGQICIGENSLYPTNFNGPNGNKGLHPSTPYFGDREKTLEKGDLIFIDIAFCIEGYNTDHTQVYSFGTEPCSVVKAAHKECIKIQNMTVDLMTTGAIPSQIFNQVTKELDPKYTDKFMGHHEQIKFLGHGIGLYVSEYPIIANRFNEPLEKNMVFAIEPKIAVPGEGMVGVEDVYIVTDNECECLTGGGREIIRI